MLCRNLIANWTEKRAFYSFRDESDDWHTSRAHSTGSIEGNAASLDNAQKTISRLEKNNLAILAHVWDDVELPSVNQGSRYQSSEGQVDASGA